MSLPIELGYLKEILHYDPAAGHFTWRVEKGPFIRRGMIAGAINTAAHRQIKIDGRMFAAHRLAWLYVTGEMPMEEIDHRNGDRDDNRISNLRPCGRAENMQNRSMSRSNRSGYMGVTFHRGTKRWLAAIKVCKQRHYLGYYDSPEEAHQAYLLGKKKFHHFQPTPREQTANG